MVKLKSTSLLNKEEFESDFGKQLLKDLGITGELEDVARTYYLIGTSSKDFAEAYLSTMGYKVSDISEYIELVKVYRKLESL